MMMIMKFTSLPLSPKKAGLRAKFQKENQARDQAAYKSKQ